MGTNNPRPPKRLSPLDSFARRLTPGMRRALLAFQVWCLLVLMAWVVDPPGRELGILQIPMHLFGVWEARGSALILPVAFLLGLAYGATLIQQLYIVDNYREVFWLLLDMLFDLTDLRKGKIKTRTIKSILDKMGFPKAWFIIKEGKTEKKNEKSAVGRIGGPAVLVLYEDSAVVLERDGKFQRIVGPGSSVLGQFEIVREMVDLRRIIRRGILKGLTKDGIPVRVELEIEFQIQPRSLPPAPRDVSVSKTPYSFRDTAVYRAAYNQVVAQNKVYHWDEVVWLLANIKLRNLLRCHILDRLLEPEDCDPEGPLDLQQSPLWCLEVELRRNLQQAAYEYGASICRVDLSPVQIDTDFAEQIEKERIEVWQAEWKRRAKIRTKDSEVEGARLKEFARAQAQADIITAIVRSLPANIDSPTAQRIIAIRVFESMEELAMDPLAENFVPEEAIHTLREFHDALSRHVL